MAISFMMKMSSMEASLITRLPKDLIRVALCHIALGEVKVVRDPPGKYVQIAPALHSQPLNFEPLMPLFRADDLKAQGLGRSKQPIFVLLAFADHIYILGGRP